MGHSLQRAYCRKKIDLGGKISAICVKPAVLALPGASHAVGAWNDNINCLFYFESDQQPCLPATNPYRHGGLVAKASAS